MSEMSPGIFHVFLNWAEYRVNVLLCAENAPHLDVISDECKAQSED